MNNKDKVGRKSINAEKGFPEELYDTHEFYEIVDGEEVGPVRGIRRCVRSSGESIGEDYEYVQILNDMPVAAFKKGELITKGKQ